MTEKKTTAQEVREAEAAAGAALLGAQLQALQHITTDTERDPELAAEAMTDAELADAVALLQDVRARQGLVERSLTVALGQRMGKGTGSLSDGRMFTMARSSDRKEWDHDDWKRDARRAIVTGITDHIGIVEDLVDIGSGQVVSLASVLHEAIAQAQAVHGATSPKSTALKALGLYASDYCTSVPSGWRFTAVKPSTPTTDTTKDTTSDD